MMEEPVNIKLSDHIVEIEGVKISIAALKGIRNPPGRSLFSFKRVGEQLEVTRFDNAESASKFFAQFETNL